MRACPSGWTLCTAPRLTLILPGRRGEPAWQALLQAHATLIRQLDTDLRKHTSLRLADFDVLAQLAAAGGELLRRANTTDDGRGVVVALTDAGVARLTQTAPVHLRGVSKLFVERLDDQELAVLETALRKVTVDCTFG